MEPGEKLNSNFKGFGGFKGKKPNLGSRFKSKNSKFNKKKPIEEKIEEDKTKIEPKVEAKVTTPPPKVEQPLKVEQPPKTNTPNTTETPDGGDNEIKTLLKSRKFKERIQAYEEIKKWDEKNFSKIDFIKQSTVLLKEKHMLVIDALISVLETVIELDEFKKTIEIDVFLNTFIEQTLSNAKGKSKKRTHDFIDLFWDSRDDKDKIIEILGKNLESKKVKVQDKTLIFILELIKKGNVAEMNNLAPFVKGFIKLTKSRTSSIRKNVVNVYKEAYIWLGKKFDPEIEKLGKPQIKDIRNFISELTDDDMKVGQKKEKKAKKAPAKSKKKEIKKPEIKKEEEKIVEDKFPPKKSLRESRLDLKETASSPVDYLKILKDFNIEEIKNLDTIAKLRNNLLDEKILKVTENKILEKLVDIHLQNIIRITEEFSKLKKVQIKQIYMIIQDISDKLPKFVLSKLSRKIIAHFYVEQINSNFSDDILNSITIYTNEKNQKILKKLFITDLLEVTERKKLKATNDFVNTIAILVEKEIITGKSLSAIPHKDLIDFIKNNITSTQNKQMKDRIFNLMRNISQLFGKNCLETYPAGLIKEFEIQNKEINMEFNKMIDKLKEKKAKIRKLTILELINVQDPTMLQMLWSSQDFLKFIKRSLITETKIDFYRKIITIVLNYLQFHKTSPADFSLKSYLYIFHTIITQYYDLEGNENERNTKPERFEILQEIFTKTIQALKPTIIFNQMIGDMNSQNWKEQILGFYLQYGNLIDVEVGFVDYIIDISSSKNLDNEIRNLINKVLIQLKQSDNDEIIEKGNENKTIREIWQRNEEDILFADEFISYERIFKDKGFYESVKNFIIRALEITEKNFFSLKIDTIIIENNQDTSNKAKIAYLYLRSNENLPSTAEHILMQIRKVDLDSVDSVTILIIIRILINLLKNNFYAQGDTFYQDIFEFFSEIIQNLTFTIEKLIETLQLQPHEIKMVTLALAEDRGEQEQIQTDNLNVTVSVLNRTVNDQNHDQYGFDNDQSRYNYTTNKLNQTNMKDISRQSRKSRINLNNNQNISHLNPFNKDQGMSVHSYKSHISKTSLLKKNALGYNQDNSLENPHFLQQQFDNMLTFDLDQFGEASVYFKELCDSKNEDTKIFLANNGNNIINIFTTVFNTVFQNGINYDLDIGSYALIFDPLKRLCSHKILMCSLNQEVLNNFVDEILKRLVISNEEKSESEQMQEEKEKITFAEAIVKQFNGIMLRVIENSEINILLTSFFIVLLNTKNVLTPKITNSVIQLTLRCILRITNNLKNKIKDVDPCIMFSLIYNYLEGVENDQNNYGNKIIKKLLKELVTHSDQDYIIECYNQVFDGQDETNIKQMIQILHNNMNKSVNDNNFSEAQKALLDVIEDFNCQKITSKTKYKLTNYFEQIAEILMSEPSIEFRNFKGYFKNRKYFEYFSKNLAMKLSRYRKDDSDYDD